MYCQLRIVCLLHVLLSPAIIAIPLSAQFAEIKGTGIARNFWMVLTFVQGKSVLVTKLFPALLTSHKFYVLVLSFTFFYMPTKFVFFSRKKITPGTSQIRTDAVFNIHVFFSQHRGSHSRISHHSSHRYNLTEYSSSETGHNAVSCNASKQYRHPWT